MAERKRRNEILLPVVATVTSALAGYVAKKGPQYLEQTLLPKLRETKQSAGIGGDSSEDEASNESIDELERRRRERAEHRAARRKAS